MDVGGGGGKGADFPWEPSKRNCSNDAVDKMSERCLWSACKAISVGLLLMACGAAMATLGFYSDHLSTVEERRGNSTVLIKNENRDWQLDSLTYLGPMVMGLGGFIIVATCVMTFEARESRVSKLSWFKRTRAAYVAPDPNDQTAVESNLVSSPGVQPDPPSDISWDRRSFFLTAGGRGSPSITTEQSNASTNRRRRSSFGDIAPLHKYPSEPSLAHQVVTHLQLSSLSPGTQMGQACRKLFVGPGAIVGVSGASAVSPSPGLEASLTGPLLPPGSIVSQLQPQQLQETSTTLKGLQSPDLLKPPRQTRAPRCSADLRQVLSFDCAPPNRLGNAPVAAQVPQYLSLANSPFGPESRPLFAHKNATTSQNSMAAEVYLAEGGGVTRFKITDRSRTVSGEGVSVGTPRDPLPGTTLDGSHNSDRDVTEQRRLSSAGKSDSTESRSLKTPSPAHRHHHRHHHHHHHRHGLGPERRRLSSANQGILAGSGAAHRSELQRLMTIAVDSGLISPPDSSPLMSPANESPSSPTLPSQPSITIKRFPFVRQKATAEESGNMATSSLSHSSTAPAASIAKATPMGAEVADNRNEVGSSNIGSTASTGSHDTPIV